MAEKFTALITRGLKTSFIGRIVIYYPTLTSTMDTAQQIAQQGARDGTIIIAGEQTAGKGRMKRSWVSPLGNIALTIILYPDISSLPYIIMIASLAVVHAIETVTGVKTQIKWPNDIIIDGKKVCGILIENKLKASSVEFSLVGIGINTHSNVAARPELATTATSLKSPAGQDLRIKIIQALLTEFESLYLKLPDGRTIFKAWRSRLVTLGERVRATSDTQTIEGIADSVDETGALVIRQLGGNLTKIIAGDVTLRENE